MARPEKIRLGEALLKYGLVTPLQLETALEYQKGTNRRLGKILVEQKYVTEIQISQALAKQLNLNFLNLKRFDIDLNVFNKFTELQARKYKSIVLKDNKDSFLVAMADPSDLIIYDDILKILKKDIEVVCSTEEDILYIIDKNYKNKDSLTIFAQELEQDITKTSGINLNSFSELSVEDAPVIKILQGLFDDAVHMHASDIHIEPQKEHTLIRFRIDGALQIHTKVNNKICAPLISRLKIISGLDISERRLPQDGRFQINIKDIPLDVRISILPQYLGESAVMRLLSQENNILELDKIGIPSYILEPLQEMIQSNEGMILVVGPTGSGKTTTLYAALSQINNPNKKIMTIEDPVEYQLPLINQIAVNDKIDFTFSRILRSVLRQDPDVIMIGEIRDTETAQIALRSAITGHLIFSTLHTKNTLATPARLIDMGVPNYMLASALQGILSQRLIRINCSECTDTYTPSSKDLIWVQKHLNLDTSDIVFKRGCGCSYCNDTGFFGRTGIYEFLEIDSELSSCLHQNDLVNFNILATEKLKGRTMIDGLKALLINGQSSAEEIRRMGI
jgi:MSHA biogenesis protein MshE